MAQDDETLRQRNKDAAQRAALFWIELANQRQSEIIRQLLALSSVILPLSASVIVLNIQLSQSDKILLLASWLLFLFSILSGLIQLLFDSDYFVKISRDSSKRESIWSDSSKQFNKANREVEALGPVPGSSTTVPLYIQEISFCIALILLVIIGCRLLFTTRGSNSNTNNQEVRQSSLNNYFKSLQHSHHQTYE